MNTPEWFIDNVPLDPGRLESIRTRAVQGYAPTMRDTLNLLAEVERLRAESVPRSALVQVGWWANGVIRHTVSSGELAYTQPVFREDTDG